MRRAILTGCLWMLLASANAQDYGRVKPGTPLKWGMNGSVTIMDRELAQYYGGGDTSRVHQQQLTVYNTPVGGNPLATRFASLRTQCDPNTLLLSWVAVQSTGADTYTIEQSPDGRHWTVAGVVPANRSEVGEATYTFRYAKNGRDGFFRVVASSLAGERVSSDILASPCSNTNRISVTPNPIYSTTTLNVGSPVASRVKLMVLDEKGSVVQSREEGLLPGLNSLSLDLSHLPAGGYTLVLHWRNGKQEVVQLLKQ